MGILYNAGIIMVGICRRSPSFLLLVFVLLAAAYAQQNVQSATPAESPIAIFVADDYAFEGPDTLPAGWTTVQIHNHGLEPHHIQLLKLTEGKTLTDLSSALHNPLITMPGWAKHMGGPNGVGSGGIAEARVHLEPGSYALICVIPSKDGTPHVMLGMAKKLRVTDQSAFSSRLVHQYHLAMRDYEFVVVEPIWKGRHSFFVKNRGSQPHQVSLVRLDHASSGSDVLAAFSPDATTTLPGTLMGGITGLEPGGEGSFTADLSQGRYAFICLFPNPNSPSSHAAMGMVMNFTVR
jgi:hypothetical protein